jgi:mRNA-degrading endonuclease toxin of MazEF toxin-antitoxin module
MKRGEVVLVDGPFSDRTGSKLRPAVVVQADFLNGLIDDTVLAGPRVATLRLAGDGSGGAGPSGS